MPQSRPSSAVATSNSLRAAPLDNTERRLDGRERYVVGHNRLAEAFQGERAKLFSCDASLQGDVDALTEQNLAVRGRRTKTGGDIAHGADGGVAGALGKSDLAQRRVALRDPGSKAQMTATLA